MADPVKPSVLIGAWRHSHEEDTGSVSVYRPAGYRFPPARGRKGFEFREDGTLAGTGYGPADRPSTSAGRWAVKGRRLQIEGPEGTQSLEIESVTPDRLILKKPAK